MKPIKADFPEIPDLAGLLKQDVYELCQPEGRMVGSKGHKVAEDWVRRRLEEVGCQPYSGDRFDLPYTCRNQDFTNFAGVIRGKDSSLPPVLIGAHYDSVIAAPCADDNGAAVAICLAVAKMAAKFEALERDLIIAIFDAEEPPHFMGDTMGSFRFYEDQLDDRGVHFAMIHDLVGHDVSLPIDQLPGAGKLLGKKDVGIPYIKDALFMMGAESHPALARLVSNAEMPKRIKLAATLNKYVGDLSDHGVFRQNGVPYLFFSCGWWSHYHQPSDTPDRLNYQKVARITELSWSVIQQVDSDPLNETASGDYSLDFEIQTMKKTFGKFLPMILKWVGCGKLETRADIEKVVDKLVRVIG